MAIFYKKADPFLIDTVTIMLKWMMGREILNDFDEYNKNYIDKIINEVTNDLSQKRLNHYFDSCGVIDPILTCYEKYRNRGIELPKIGKLDHKTRPRF